MTHATAGAFTGGMHALVFAAGEPPSATLAAELRDRATLVIAADSGADRALALDITPDYVVGDLDSLSDDARELLGPERLRQDAIGDRSDIEKAVEFAIAQGATSVDIACAGGGRADHALANLSTLIVFRGQARVALVDDLFTITLVDGVATVDAPVGTVVSLVAPGVCEGVTTTGMRWNLTGFRLPFGSRGIHNEVAEPPATVRHTSGHLFLFEGRWVEHHL